MAKVINRGYNPKHFQQIMGRGGVISSRPRQEQPEALQLIKPVPDSRSEIQREVDQIFQEAQESGNVAFPSEKTAESKSITGDASTTSRK